ncbi:GNAT family N-acetyltransferase [Frigidibacter sp. ROC022]|uniref:GNAT family N-acetyltransferase n=1 Tax=Frigidibacter sp. ROC022 TaxID=2971796 RepID=UPI00215B6A31|nr:GNAT family N-acetyltransferase [Frigidibacter sp. ROC022]MCR8724032.1 GNAT family N-acetyltransferase [Frigidibacter sp. ROC022]
MTPPTLTTARLTLRPQVLADFEPFAEMLASDRARYMGGPIQRNEAWGWFCADEAGWTFLDHGALSVTETASGRLAGQVGLNKPPRFPEIELGWLAYDWAEGRGYMTEAARALRDWAFGPRGLTTLVSYVDPANLRSRALAERLGARIDPKATGPDPDDVVYRHSPEAA